MRDKLKSLLDAFLSALWATMFLMLWNASPSKFMTSYRIATSRVAENFAAKNPTTDGDVSYAERETNDQGIDLKTKLKYNGVANTNNADGE